MIGIVNPIAIRNLIDAVEHMVEQDPHHFPELKAAITEIYGESSE